jgi:excisionase family DNA binding protein
MATEGRQLETILEAAARTRVSARTLRRWIADGRLTAYRYGPHLIRLDPAEVDALLRPIPTVGNLRVAI